MKCAIYVRVSRNDLNLDNQKIPLIEYVKRMGWDYNIFEEKESTRKTRPVQWDLYNRLLRKEYDILLFYKLDRWARSLAELVQHVESLLEKNVRIISHTENLDFGTSMGRFMFHVIGAFSQFERDLIRERTLAGLARAKAQGKKLGRPRKASFNEIKKFREQGFSYEQIGKKLGVSKQAIFKRLNPSIAKN